MQRRNKLVHTGADHPATEETIAALDAVTDLLWLLDFHLGHSWAAEYLSYQTQLDLGLLQPSPVLATPVGPERS